MSSSNKYLIDGQIDAATLSTKVNQFMNQLDQYVDLKIRSKIYKQQWLKTKDDEDLRSSESCEDHANQRFTSATNVLLETFQKSQ
tara:strand:+ start:193 stop:447 length:255 start_codon:yes stop_codon:yes gene_type:complete